MKRITVKMVEKALDQTGLELQACTWGDGETCGCPQTVLFVAKFHRAPNEISEVMEWAENQYGEHYARSFRAAFDKFDHHGFDQNGYSDGLAVRTALFENHA